MRSSGLLPRLASILGLTLTLVACRSERDPYGPGDTIYPDGGSSTDGAVVYDDAGRAIDPRWDAARADAAATDGGGSTGVDGGSTPGCGSEPCPLEGGEPRFEVRFTAPVCAAMPEMGVPAGVRCYGTRTETDASRAAAGIVDHLIRWIDATRQAKVDHPERDVKITMAYLTWSDSRIYSALCAATAAGVRFDGFFDRGDGGSQPGRFAGDAACHPENISVSYLGGVTEYPDWRLMHVKMMMFETGNPVTRLVVGSANMSSYGTSIHFENWVFGELASDSHFIASHRCAAEALRADRYASAGATTYPATFRATYDACVARITAAADPRFRVFFTPDGASGPTLEAILATLRGASTTVDIAAQHLSSPDLVRQMGTAGMDSRLRTRILLDDDTYYDDGDTGGVDHMLYEAFLADSGATIRFLQTNYHLDFGAQYQHNKYIVVDGRKLVFGAGNFTSSGFSNNYENYYIADYAPLVSQFVTHYERVFGLGKSAESLPATSMY